MYTPPLPGTASDRARFRAAVADTHARVEALLDDLRARREHHVRASESLAIERRILHDDYAHWRDERT